MLDTKPTIANKMGLAKQCLTRAHSFTNRSLAVQKNFSQGNKE